MIETFGKDRKKDVGDYRKAVENYKEGLVVGHREREKQVSSFIKNVSRGGGKAKASRSLGVSLTGNRRY